MLQLTNRAAAALRDERAQRGIPDSFGLRVHHDPSDSQAGLQLHFVQAPFEGDEVGAAEGVDLFVAQEVAGELTAEVIDVQESTEGSSLVLRHQTDFDE